MVQADISSYINIVDFFREEEAKNQSSALRTIEAEKKSNEVSSHKLDALHDEGILERWHKGSGDPYPVKEKTGERIGGDEAEELVNDWFPDLVSEVKDSRKRKAIDEELEDDSFKELSKSAKSKDLSEKVSASNKLLDALEEVNLQIETEFTRIGFRRPSHRWYLSENYTN